MNVSRIQFGLCSPFEVERRSVVEIEFSEHFDECGNVKYGGLFDPRMGCTERGKICITCNENYVHCNGHFGYLKLAVPVFHVAYLNKITKILRCFCFNCSRLLVRDTKKLNYIVSLPMKNRLDKMCKFSLSEKNCVGDETWTSASSFVENSKDEEECTKKAGRKRGRRSQKNQVKRIKHHNGCDKSQPSYKRYELYDFYAEWNNTNTAQLVLDDGSGMLQFCNRNVQLSGNGKVQLSVFHIKDFFSRVNEDDLELIGFSQLSKPEWIILNNIFIAPPVVRPSAGLSFDTDAIENVSFCVSDKWNTICDQIIFHYSKLKFNKTTMEDKIKTYFAQIKDADCSGFFSSSKIIPNLNHLEKFFQQIANDLTVAKILFPSDDEVAEKSFWKTSDLYKRISSTFLEWHLSSEIVSEIESLLTSYKSADDIRLENLFRKSAVYNLYEFLKSCVAKVNEIHSKRDRDDDQHVEEIDNACMRSLADKITKKNSQSGHSTDRWRKNCSFTIHHDDLTSLYTNVIKVNNEIKILQMSNMGTEYAMKCKQLQALIFHLMGGDVGGKLNLRQNSFLNSNKQLKCLKDRIQGKDGRIRANLMGKRVDFSARSVITGDANLKISQVGIPLAIARTLTIPEIVTERNKAKLTAIANNDVGKYPNVNFIIRKKTKKRFDIRAEKTQAIMLETGDIVERQLMNGDAVVFNRQPTLHKMSMMGHIAKVLPWSTFRLNLSCTTPYNADFDGDEMNLHVPQSLASQAETRQLLLSSRHLVTPQSCKPVMGIVQDALTGAFKFTGRNFFFDQAQAHNLCMHIPDFTSLPRPCIIKPKPMWSGKQIFSLLIPKRLFLMKNLSDSKDRWICANDRNVIIEDGQLISGSLCKQILGTACGSLLHICFLHYGHKVCEELYNNIQCLINAWIQQAGHTVGISDLILKNHFEITDNITNAIRDSISTTDNDKFSNFQSKEIKINQILNKAIEDCGKIAKNNVHYRNNIKSMIESGSKGSDLNLSQMTACVGQQNVNGLRIPLTFRNRSLPHYYQFDNSVESRGFVTHSYYDGLNPTEFFFHAMAGREGLIDTAVKTAISGYIQRRLIKSMESLMAQYDGTVRDCNNVIYQFRYGDDGFAAEYIETVDMKECFIGIEIFLSEFKNKKYFQREYENISHLSDCLNRLYPKDQNGGKKYNRGDILENSRLPINIPRAVLFLFGRRNKTAAYKILNKRLKHLHLEQIEQDYFTLTITNKKHEIEQHEIVSPFFVFEKYNQLISKLSSRFDSHNENIILKCYLAFHLSWQNLVLKNGLTVTQIEKLCNKIEQNILLAEIQPGEMVGSLAAQSIGEPTTQMTLNTFHHAGVSSKNVTLGVPRLDEILNMTAKPKSPRSVVYLDSNYVSPSVDSDQKTKLINRAIWDIKFTTIENLKQYSAILYCTENDRENWIKIRNEECGMKNENESIRKLDSCNWFIEICYDHSKLSQADINLKTIAKKIFKNYNNVLIIYVSGLKMFVSVNEQELTNQYELDYRFMKEIEEKWILPMNVLGIENIKQVSSHTEENNSIYFETTGSNFAQLLCNPKIDFRKSYTNDICQIHAVLGIEAARSAIEREVFSIFKTYRVEVNHRHLSLLCDTITNKGILMPINRHGINRQDTAPLLRCSFEETVDILQKAALYSERDDIKGVSESIIVGKVPKIGTGSFQVLKKIDEREADQSIDYSSSPSYQIHSPSYENNEYYTPFSPPLPPELTTELENDFCE